MKFKGFLGVVKQHWAPIALVAVGTTIFLGGIIVTAYNKLRSKSPVPLPAPKV